MITLQDNHAVATVEQHLSELASAPADTTLLLPRRLKASQFLGLPGVIQLITTWRQRCPEGDLQVHVQHNDSDAQIEALLRRFVQTDHGLVATSLAGRVTDRSGTADLTELARALMSARLAGMTTFDGIVRGPKVFAMCLDSSQHAAPGVLYSKPVVGPSGVPRSDPRLLDDDSWKVLGDSIDGRLWGRTVEGRASVRDATALAGILRELMRNTHDWARKDETGAMYGPHRSVRGFRIQFHNFDRAQHSAALGAEGPLARYFGHVRLAPRDGRRRFVELTVFDSGPGLAARFLRERLGDQEPTLAEEGEELRRCIRKHMTSSTDWHRGLGLAEVVRLANKAHGFIRVRSGRLSLFRDYLASPCRPDRADIAGLSDWRSDSDQPSPSVPVAGTSIVAVLPVGHV